jgi:peptide/nickel transport system ATP-binding protein
MSAAVPLLQVQDLSTHFSTRQGVVRAVQEVSFSLQRGQVLGLVGESGSGKSITGLSLMGLVDPPGRQVGGRILLDGQDLSGCSAEQWRTLRGRRIAMICQDPMATLNPVLRIATQMVEAIQAHETVSREAALKRCREALVRVGIPAPDARLAAYPHEFSGGMRQRVAIAIALLNRPDLIIADEPTTALDVTIQGQILFEMQRLCRESGTALIWITHDLSVVAGLADTVAVMYAGRIVELASTATVIGQPRHPYTRGLIGSVPSRNTRGTRLRQIAGMAPSPLQLDEGCAFRARCSQASAACAGDPDRAHGAQRQGGCMTPPLLELRRVSKRFEKRLDLAGRVARALGGNVREETVHAVDRVDLQVHDGEVVGLVGESGCGKSTLARLIAGLHAPSEGDVLWRRRLQDLDAAARQAARLQTQMIFQDPFASLNPRLRVVDLVGEAPVVHGLVPRAQRDEWVAEQLRRVGLDPALMDRFPHQFSGGQRARVGIARALAVKPRFLVCDEAVAALDVSIQAQVLNLFMDLRESLALTYLFISHDLGVVRHLSDRVVVMYLGRVVETAPAVAFFDSPGHPYAQALLAEVPRLEARRKDFVAISGEIPSPLDPPRGCHFHPRCPQALARCRDEAPVLKEIGSGRWVACHLTG